MTGLSKMQTALYDMFSVRGYDRDVDISLMYGNLYNDYTGTKSVRQKQQKIAPLIKATNSKLAAGRIVPGNLKQTYRLVRKG